IFCQAEDGIRSLIVTGVQTCALPISPVSTIKSARPAGTGLSRSPGTRGFDRRYGRGRGRQRLQDGPQPVEPRPGGPFGSPAPARSEERRVGKEGKDRKEAHEEK